MPYQTLLSAFPLYCQKQKGMRAWYKWLALAPNARPTLPNLRLGSQSYSEWDPSIHQGEVNSRNMTLSFTPCVGATKWVTTPFHRSGAMEFTSVGALRWVNTKDNDRGKNGTHREWEHGKN